MTADLLTNNVVFGGLVFCVLATVLAVGLSMLNRMERQATHLQARKTPESSLATEPKKNTVPGTENIYGWSPENRITTSAVEESLQRSRRCGDTCRVLEGVIRHIPRTGS